MIVLSYGGGTNSTAMLVGLMERGERPDLILFADTGGEKPHTYEHIETMQRWLRAAGWPTITTVRKEGITLERDCLDRKALPSIAYGFGWQPRTAVKAKERGGTSPPSFSMAATTYRNHEPISPPSARSSYRQNRQGVLRRRMPVHSPRFALRPRYVVRA